MLLQVLGDKKEREQGVEVIKNSDSLNDSSSLITNQRSLGVSVYPNTAR